MVVFSRLYGQHPSRFSDLFRSSFYVLFHVLCIGLSSLFYTHALGHTRAQMCTHLYTHVCLHTYMYVSPYTHPHTHVHTPAHIDVIYIYAVTDARMGIGNLLLSNKSKRVVFMFNFDVGGPTVSRLLPRRQPLRRPSSGLPDRPFGSTSAWPRQTIRHP